MLGCDKWTILLDFCKAKKMGFSNPVICEAFDCQRNLTAISTGGRTRREYHECDIAVASSATDSRLRPHPSQVGERNNLK